MRKTVKRCAGYDSAALTSWADPPSLPGLRLPTCHQTGPRRDRDLERATRFSRPEARIVAIATLRPKRTDCCELCSYGSVVCPPAQPERTGHTNKPRCCAE